MRVKITSNFQTPGYQVWALVKNSKTLVYVAKGFVGFIGSEKFPDTWIEGKTETVRLLFFHALPAWKHQITFKTISDTQKVLRTTEGGGMVRVWNHTILVEDVNKTSCRYTDDIEIEAGVLTSFVWVYVQLYYRYRQLRWRWLIKKEGL